MTWMKVDDNLHAHRKPKKAGVPAMGLWVLAGSWCADMLTDGFIPDYIAASLDPAHEEHAAALVRSGLWEVAEQDGDEGWHFTGWDEYQPTRADVENKREQARERMARVRGNRTDSSADVRANKERSAEPVLSTPSRPDPTRPEPIQKSAPRQSAKRRLPSDWKPTDAHRKTCQEKHFDLAYEADRFKSHAEAKDLLYVNWDAAFRNWLTNAKPRPKAIPAGRPSQGSWMVPRKAA